jgi:hypothetical protein
MSGVFTSPLYFKEVEQIEAPASHPPHVEVPQNFSPTPSVQTTHPASTAPVILEGAYSGDRMLFWWSGGIILTIPSLSQYGTDTTHSHTDKNTKFGDGNTGIFQ